MIIITLFDFPKTQHKPKTIISQNSHWKVLIEVLVEAVKFLAILYVYKNTLFLRTFQNSKTIKVEKKVCTHFN